MARASSGGLADLRAAVSGGVLAPGDPGYDGARRVWNSQIDRRPAAVVLCRGAADVAAAVRHARAEGLALSVRGGGHNTSGSAVTDGGLMINLSELNRVSVDPATRRARAGGGALLSDLDGATQEHGLATPAGMISHTGIGGLTLGGGMGWLSRRHGLSIDNLTGAQVVLADGEIVRADESEHPELFWALRGGGGNFGVVTTFEFALHPVGPTVHMAMLFWELERGAEALRTIRELARELPGDVNISISGMSAPAEPFVPEEHRFRPGFGLIVAGFGAPENHAAVVERARAAVAPLFEMVGPMPYTVLQTLQDEITAWGQFNYEKGTQLPELTDAVIEVLIEHLPRRVSLHSLMTFDWLDGAYSAVPEDATAYGGTRTPRYTVVLAALTPDLDTWARDRAWVRELWSALRPHSLGVGDYVNNMAEFEADRVRASYGPAKYERLMRIKAVYDPENLFRSGANIPPSTG